MTYLIAEQLSYSHKQVVCAWIGHVPSVYVRNIKTATTIEIIN